MRIKKNYHKEYYKNNKKKWERTPEQRERKNSCMREYGRKKRENENRYF